MHAAALRNIPGCDLAAVCDSDPVRAAAFAHAHGAASFASVSAMVREARVEAVCLATPHPLHAQGAIEAMEAGAHVLTEKPFAASLQDCDAMIAAARRYGRELGVISQRRFFAPVQRMKTAIDAGKIGAPILGTLQMLSWRDEAYYRSDPWRGRWDTEGGGVLVNQAPHQLDILLWLMGPLAEVSALWGNLNHPYIEVEDTAVAVLRFRNGGLGSIVASVSQKPGIYAKVHVHGSNGASIGVQTDAGATFIAGMSAPAEPAVNDLWTIPGEEHLLTQFTAEDHALYQSAFRNEYYHELQIRDFLDAVREGRRPLVTAPDGRAVVALFSAIYQSGRERRPVTFPSPT